MHRREHINRAAPESAGTVLGWVLFLIVPAGVVLGLTFIAASGSGRSGIRSPGNPCLSYPSAWIRPWQQSGRQQSEWRW
jgi:hypothetical protein